MKEREELRLVESFSELRAGMIVVWKPCGNCGGSHRGVLLSPGPIPGNGENGFPIVPLPWCLKYIPMHGVWVAASSVASKTLHRVVDPGLESSQTTQKATKRPVGVGR